METQYRLPAECEPQDAIQLTWPNAATDWQPYLKDIVSTYIELVKAITKYERVIIASADAAETLSVLQSHLSQQAFDRVSVYQCNINDTWARDHGPITLVASDTTARNKILDFKFNGWGEKFRWEDDNTITRQLYDQAVFDCDWDANTDFVLEGGSIESDGMGTILTSSQCLLAPHRNQPLTKKDIEMQLQKRLCAKRILWVDHGNLRGDDTDGHIDTIVRMAPDNTLLYIACDDPQDEQYVDLKALENQLKTLRDADGRPYRLIPLPSPRPIYDDGDRLPATYANFVIINGAVIVPTYQQSDRDAAALSAIGQAFPDYDIIGIDACTVIRQHGSLHCLTMQLPKGSLK